MKKSKLLLTGAIGMVLAEAVMGKKKTIKGNKPHDNMALSEVLRKLKYMEKNK